MHGELRVPVRSSPFEPGLSTDGQRRGRGGVGGDVLRARWPSCWDDPSATGPERATRRAGVLDSPNTNAQLAGRSATPGRQGWGRCVTHQAISTPSELVAACSSIGVTRWPLHRCQARNTTPAAVGEQHRPDHRPGRAQRVRHRRPRPHRRQHVPEPEQPRRHQRRPPPAARRPAPAARPRNASSSSTTVPSGIRTSATNSTAASGHGAARVDERRPGRRAAPRPPRRPARPRRDRQRPDHQAPAQPHAVQPEVRPRQAARPGPPASSTPVMPRFHTR